jgi:hypothetical protein
LRRRSGRLLPQASAQSLLAGLSFLLHLGSTAELLFSDASLSGLRPVALTTNLSYLPPKSKACLATISEIAGSGASFADKCCVSMTVVDFNIV